jgi:hypothetical protein
MRNSRQFFSSFLFFIGYIPTNDNRFGVMANEMQELEVQKAQLEQLKINGQLLSRIAESGGAGGGAAGASGSKNMSVYSPSFQTKDGYLNNMKLLNMSLQS